MRRWRAAYARGGLEALLDAPWDGRPKAELMVTDAERATLQRVGSASEVGAGLAMRAKIVLACADG